MLPIYRNGCTGENAAKEFILSRILPSLSVQGRVFQKWLLESRFDKQEIA
jgi:hypothetical protein